MTVNEVLPRSSRLAARTSCRGFTLIELLVVLAILGTITALLMSAIQVSREASRRSQCQNNLKQLGMAVHIHHDVFRRLPSNGWGYRWMADPRQGAGLEQPGGWMFTILPYLEQQQTHHHAFVGNKNASDDELIRLLQTPVGVFNCPTRRGAELYPYTERRFPLFNGPVVTKAAKSDYAICGGHVPIDGGMGPRSVQGAAHYRWPDTSAASGVSFVRSRFRLADIRDGSSNTLLAGEKYVTTGMLDLGDDQTMYVGDDADTRRWAHAPPLHDAWQQPDPHRFGSSHPSVCNVVLCDGAVKALPYTIDTESFKALGNRHDGRAFVIE